MEDFVNSTCRAAFFHLRNISHVRPYLDRATTEKVIHAFVTSRIDYCNSLLYGASVTLIKKLQRVQNMAARIVTCRGKYEHISPVLKELHWLNVDKRIKYKVLLNTYKCMNNLSPAYLSSLLSSYEPSRQLRSSSKQLLNVPRCKLRTFGENAYCSYAPRLWNVLPADIKSSSSIGQFKSKLKSYSF